MADRIVCIKYDVNKYVSVFKEKGVEVIVV